MDPKLTETQAKILNHVRCGGVLKSRVSAGGRNGFIGIDGIGDLTAITLSGRALKRKGCLDGNARLTDYGVKLLHQHHNPVPVRNKWIR